ncbi:efflux RND transporter periplasmic adaptor subunit [Chitinophagaceae bacterium LB-8]|uniref:Efflux RND transporter periplasmic adaptor subunit n=1 Tax=Paraflavisolibacter caeni TaxID=2982496 RepID=A0A9X3BH05_9BACT|nr:efflux RND transporter periplasmic adaptor subunit [Paraflavisolibacter caeni]MCU7551769.1 efflux RND transporter periplasmic adaptor subunit [Paraflavisolibacter caeni]
MKKQTLIIVIISMIALAALSWIINFKEKRNLVELLTEKPSFGSLSKTVTATGTLQPVDTVAIGAQVSGTIKNIFVDFNSVVKKGQLLAELDPVLFLAQEHQIEANLQQAKANFAYQAANYNRQQQLYNAGAISKAEIETATYQYRAAQDNVNSILSQLRAAQKSLSFTRIYSPIDGTVLTRNISVGQTVAASFNTPTLFSIANDLTHMQVRASVDEADIGMVQKGQRVKFTVDAYPDEIFYGTVEEIRLEPSVTANVVTYTTIIEADNANLKLKPGMTANIDIVTQEQDNVLLIPQIATQFVPGMSLSKQFMIRPLMPGAHQQRSANNKSGMKAGNHFSMISNQARVWVKKGDTLVQKQIITGLSNDVQEAVIKGLSPDDLVVTSINANKGPGKASTEERSPFIPTRSSRNGR